MLTQRLYEILKSAQTLEKGEAAMKSVEEKIKELLAEFPLITLHVHSAECDPNHGFIIIVDSENSNALIISLTDVDGAEIMTTDTASFSGVHEPQSGPQKLTIGLVAKKLSGILDPTVEGKFTEVGKNKLH